jgi:hypothetical protein
VFQLGFMANRHAEFFGPVIFRSHIRLYWYQSTFLEWSAVHLDKSNPDVPLCPVSGPIACRDGSPVSAGYERVSIAALRVQRGSKIDRNIPALHLLAPAYYRLNRLHDWKLVILLLITKVFQLAQICFEAL